MIVCWFSCGAASACATKLAIEKYGRENIRVVNNPVVNEHPDNKRFLEDCEKSALEQWNTANIDRPSN